MPYQYLKNLSPRNKTGPLSKDSNQKKCYCRKSISPKRAYNPTNLQMKQLSKVKCFTQSCGQMQGFSSVIIIGIFQCFRLILQYSANENHKSQGLIQMFITSDSVSLNNRSNRAQTKAIKHFGRTSHKRPFSLTSILF